MPHIGEQIGPYTLVRQLGRGAFGLVWLAERRSAFATTQVAIKLALDDEPDLAAIAKESQLWSKLRSHPNILPIIEADKYDDQLVIVSEYAPDGSLDTWLKKNNGIAPSMESAIAMTMAILSGLEHLHSKGKLFIET
ncbi:MAG: protein kinase [Blastocatellia bacterium]|nr:protein kinase [Blastocatellia bacterium]